MHNNVNYDFIFESTPKLIDLTESSIRGFRKILFIDSIFDFFPRVEVFFKDPNGIILDQTYFIENLDFTIKLGDEVNGYAGGEYVWAKNEFNEIDMQNFLSGTNAMILVSKYLNKNAIKNKSFNSTIKAAIEKIISTDYSITDNTKKFISNTTGIDVWRQGATKNSDFIQDLSDYAYDQAHNRSPFYTFINSNQEFYFMHLNDLFSQKPVNTIPYTLEMQDNTSTNPYAINDYIIQNPGMEINFENYKIKSYETTKTGASNSQEQEYIDFVHKDSNEKLLIRKEYVETNKIIYTGINETTQDKYNYQGLVNSIYRDSALSNRMSITIPFNSKIACGKLIDVKINSVFEDKEVLKEYSGNWLILKSLHHENKDGMAYSNIWLGKSTMYADSKHPFYVDFQ